MKDTLKKILDLNETKFGADYGDRKVNNEGIVFDYSGLGYHIRVDSVKEPIPIKKNQNFISVDGMTAISSYGEYFTIGETVNHEDKDAGEATILSFRCDINKNEVVVYTNKGLSHLDFLVKNG